MKSKIILLSGLLVATFVSCLKKSEEIFLLELIQEKNNKISEIIKSNEFNGEALQIKPTSEKQSLIIWEGTKTLAWEKANYLVCEIWHKNEYAAILNLEFYKNEMANENIVTQSGSVAGSDEKPRMSAKIGVLPLLKTKVIFPLEHLNGQEIFMKRFPRQLKGTVLGSRMKAEEISKVVIRIGPFQEPRFKPEIEIASISLTNELPEPYQKPEFPLTDKFGQWARKNWHGKTESEEALKALLEQQLKQAENATFPENWSKYGGWKEKQFQATGFFRTQHDGNRWWLVDPDGFAFVSVGIDCIRNNVSGLVSGQEDLFEWLPEENDKLYSDIYNARGDYRQIDFYKANFIRVFGEDWNENWEKITTGLIKEFGINTIANWSDIDYARKARIPYVLPLSQFPSTEIKLYRDFPDVFAREYQNNAKIFAQQLHEFKNDPYLIGYFLRNEPHWAFGAHDIAFEMFGTTETSESKKMFAKWLSQKYNSVEELNAQWNLKLETFEEITKKEFTAYPSEKSRGDFWKFSEILVAKYVNIPCDEVEKVDPNHLNLGMRYAWISSDLLYKAGERFDVFSINGYGNPGPPETGRIAEISGKPVMIGEFHFGATDRGLPATGIQGAINQNERAKAYRYYVEQGLTRPELIGMHYFQWLDQPIFGRFDGENYNIGFIDICNKPYNELTEAARLTHFNMYQIASGQAEPYNEILEKIPSIHY